MTQTQSSSQSLPQRADLTFKANLHHGRHGWLRLTPAYSVKLVESILAQEDGVKTVLDPFAGSGTTPLAASYVGCIGVGLELNPFLQWLGAAKTREYRPGVIEEAREKGLAVSRAASDVRSPLSPPPPIHAIERWWAPEVLIQLRRLYAAILEADEPGNIAHDLLLVAFSRLVISQSNAAFNHQSMSFRSESAQLCIEETAPQLPALFLRELKAVLSSARDNPVGSASVELGDARHLSPLAGKRFDSVITSPPYPNRISYIRELRPYMYWLGYLQNGKEAGQLDWQAIGGTWGSATSSLSTWNLPEDSQLPESVTNSASQIRHSEAKSASVLAKYVEKYFHDMWKHLISLIPHLNRGASVHYVVGNSQFYGTMVHTETAYAEMLSTLGLRDVRVSAIRKRNSKKSLVEFDVSARRED